VWVPQQCAERLHGRGGDPLAAQRRQQLCQRLFDQAGQKQRVQLLARSGDAPGEIAEARLAQLGQTEDVTQPQELVQIAQRHGQLAVRAGIQPPARHAPPVAAASAHAAVGRVAQPGDLDQRGDDIRQRHPDGHGGEAAITPRGEGERGVQRGAHAGHRRPRRQRRAVRLARDAGHAAPAPGRSIVAILATGTVAGDEARRIAFAPRPAEREPTAGAGAFAACQPQRQRGRAEALACVIGHGCAGRTQQPVEEAGRWTRLVDPRLPAGECARHRNSSEREW